MTASTDHISWFSSAWEVLLLFVIPVGGGIPAGVLLARNRGLVWPVMVLLYFVSDLILACVFEPLMLLVIATGKRIQWVARMTGALKKMTQKSTANYGPSLGPFSLILIAFGVDPMTGRSVAAAAGHGFVSGWALAITGDLLYFGVLMVSTLWLNNILGDETRTTLIIMGAMFLVPYLVKRVRQGRKKVGKTV